MSQTTIEHVTIQQSARPSFLPEEGRGVDVRQGPTPNGGAWIVAYFLDANRDLTDKENAQQIEVIELDEKGNHIQRTYLIKDR